MIASMMIAGPTVRPELLRELAEIVDEPTASVLEHALEVETMVLALFDRGTGANHPGSLDDPPAGLAELRGVLLREHEW